MLIIIVIGLWLNTGLSGGVRHLTLEDYAKLSLSWNKMYGQSAQLQQMELKVKIKTVASRVVFTLTTSHRSQYGDNEYWYKTFPPSIVTSKYI